MKKSKISILLTLIFCFLFVIPAHSASIKDRMASRMPVINELKNKGIIGENNKGFLEYRTPDHPKQKIIDAENKDRNTVYMGIAKKQKAPAELVGKRRARMIAGKGKKGHWFQDPKGVWYKK